MAIIGKNRQKSGKITPYAEFYAEFMPNRFFTLCRILCWIWWKESRRLIPTAVPLLGLDRPGIIKALRSELHPDETDETIAWKEIVTTETDNVFITFWNQECGADYHCEELRWGGATLMAQIKNTRRPFSIDFGNGDVSVPRQVNWTIPTQVPDFFALIVYTCSLETTVMEKLVPSWARWSFPAGWSIITISNRLWIILSLTIRCRQKRCAKPLPTAGITLPWINLSRS